EGLELELHQTDLGAREDRNGDPLRIKSLVEELHYPNGHPVDLIEEEDISSAKLAKKIYQGREARDEGARGHVGVALKLLGDALRQCRFSQAGWTGKENRRRKLSPQLGGFDGDREALDGGLLADKRARVRACGRCFALSSRLDFRDFGGSRDEVLKRL